MKINYAPIYLFLSLFLLIGCKQKEQQYFKVTGSDLHTPITGTFASKTEKNMPTPLIHERVILPDNPF